MKALESLSSLASSRVSRALRSVFARRFLVLCAFLIALPLSSRPAFAQTLVNGGSVGGSISVAGDLDTFSFSINAGEGYQLRVVDFNVTSLTPQMWLYEPGGALVATNWGTNVASLAGSAASSGTYTLDVADRNGTGTGSYLVYFTGVPGANEGGALVNGSSVPGSIALGDLDSFTISINAGEGYQLRVADTTITSLTPQMWLYNPAGTLVTTAWGTNVASLAGSAALTGTYTIVIADRNNSGTGPYDVHYTRVPGANEGGALVNGSSVPGSIALGDLDSFTFNINAGEGYQLRVVDTTITSLTPQMWLYNPAGTLVTTAWGTNVASLAGSAALTGTYTIVIADRNNSGTGPYDVHYTRVPGANEGGALVNGGSVFGTIDLGDLDSFTFTINAGEGYQLRMADSSITSLTPQVWLYNPAGTIVTTAWGTNVASLAGSAATTGTYTIVVADRNNSGTGDYDVFFTSRPGANEGGALINGGLRSGFIDLGDLDSYTFSASAGEGYQLRMVDVAITSLTPQMWLYNPAGSLVSTAWGTNVAALAGVVPSTGTYTLVVADRNNSGTGAYDVHYTLAPGANEGGALVNGGTLNGFIDLGDLDSFTYTALAGEGIDLQMVDTALTTLTPQMWLYNPAGTLVVTAWGTNVATIATTAATTGTYTLVLADRNNSGTGAYGLGFTRGLETYCTPGTTANGCMATISAVGDPSATAGAGFNVSAAFGEGNKDGLFFFGTSGRQANSWGTGTSFQCVVPPVKRTPLVSGGGTNGNCDGHLTFDFNALITVQPAKAPPVGSVIQMQCWYRDPFNTSNQSTSLSDALEFTLKP